MSPSTTINRRSENATLYNFSVSPTCKKKYNYVRLSRSLHATNSGRGAEVRHAKHETQT